jgi:hypothetical protein
LNILFENFSFNSKAVNSSFVNIIKSLVSVRDNNHLSIVDASGHTAGFYGLFSKNKYFYLFIPIIF